MDSRVSASYREATWMRDEYNRPGIGIRRILAMSGLPLSGKSYLANQILAEGGGLFNLIRSDEVRPVVARAMGKKHPSFTSEEHELTFETTGLMLEKTVSLGWPTIVDATNLRERYRQWIYDAADKEEADVLVCFMEVSDAIAATRVREDFRSGSTATVSVYEQLKYETEPPERCSRPYVTVNSEGNLTNSRKRIISWLCGEVDDFKGMRMPRHKQ